MLYISLLCRIRVTTHCISPFFAELGLLRIVSPFFAELGLLCCISPFFAERHVMERRFHFLPFCLSVLVGLTFFDIAVHTSSRSCSHVLKGLFTGITRWLIFEGPFGPTGPHALL